MIYRGSRGRRSRVFRKDIDIRERRKKSVTYVMFQGVRCGYLEFLRNALNGTTRLVAKREVGCIMVVDGGKLF